MTLDLESARAWPSEATVESLPNLGPLSSAVLRRCGILSAGQLRQLGPSRAYLCVKREYGQAPRSLLWALEGALSDRPWQQVATAERLGLLLEVDEIERSERSG